MSAAQVTTTRKNLSGVSYVRYGTRSSFESLGKIECVDGVWIGTSPDGVIVRSTYRAATLNRLLNLAIL